MDIRTTSENPTGVDSPGLGRVTVLALGVFAVGTGEFVLAGLLPLLMDSFAISAAKAGQIVTVFAMTCAIAAPLLTTLTASWPRRTVLIVATVIYLIGSAGTALASTYEKVLLAQIIAAAGVGLFIPNASVTAAALVHQKFQGRAIAIVVTGFTAAVSLGAPFGTALGGFAGWRATMWFTAALALPGLLGVLILVPKHVSTTTPGTLAERLAPLADRRVLAVMATTLLGFTAVFIPYTYVGVIFAPATAGSSVALAVLMFTLGIVGAIGNFGAGVLADKIGGARVVAIALIWLAVSTVILPWTTTQYGAAVAMIAFYALAAFAITTPQQHRLMSLRPDAAAVLISLNQAVLYLAIAMSGVVGALGIQWVGAQYVSLIAAILAIIALAVSNLATEQT
ncbi:MFS transporter [Pelagibacterium halotolerans]|uniref:MFS transporter n=1 Tax=Pelagibacterium halotolerans TaxID=531813 RepID=UPI0008977312|nr:MFS transporter [Pelagibacterium halotolerans]QJR20262.1 MFS transporter [Pelagibacterium halotolerans]SEA57449.1 MFS transporter, DHA1 family, inner membrane transport protein [Pelagibacterium halotolerans]